MTLADLIHQKQFTSPTQEAMLNVIVTGSWILNELGMAMTVYGITPAQYNVLRILRGAHPEKLTCSAIGARLLDRTPDVTRLLNRLERTELIRRARATHDRRVVEVAITDYGLELLDKVDPAVAATQDAVMQHLTSEECQTLTGLLERLRIDQHT